MSPPVAKSAAIRIAAAKRREIMWRMNGNYAANCSAIVYVVSKASHKPSGRPVFTPSCVFQVTELILLLLLDRSLAKWAASPLFCWAQNWRGGRGIGGR